MELTDKQKKLARELLESRRYRNFEVRATKENDDDKDELLRFTASSREPVLSFVETEDFFGVGYEVLSHASNDINLERKNAMHFLLDHNQKGADNNLGMVRELDPDGEKLNAAVEQNPHNPTAERVFKEIRDGFRPNVSVGFDRETIGTLVGEKDGHPVVEYKWTPMEISSVLVPADNTVGFGRDDIEQLILREFDLDRRKKGHKELVNRLLDEFVEEEEEVEEETREKGERPFGDYEDFDDCVAQNQDKDDPEAYCGEIQASAEKSESNIFNKEIDSSERDLDDDKLIIPVEAATNNNEEKSMSDEIKVGEAREQLDESALQKRYATITEICNADGRVDLAVKAINEGWSVERTKAELHDLGKSSRTVETVEDEKLTEQEQKELDVTKAIRNYVQNDESSEIDELGRKVAKERGVAVRQDAIYIPTNLPVLRKGQSRFARPDPFTRALGTTPAAQGGNIVGTEYLSIVEAIFEAPISQMLGVQFIQSTNQLQVPRFLTNQPVAWVGEGSSISLASGSFALETLTPNQLVAAVPITPFLGTAQAGTYDPINAIFDNILGSLQEQRETAIFQGGGGVAPTGIINDTDVPNVSQTGSIDLYTALYETARVSGSATRVAPYVVGTDVYVYGVKNASLSTGTDIATIRPDPAGLASGITDVGRVMETQHMPLVSALGGDFRLVLGADFGVIELRRDQSVRSLSGEDVLFGRLFFDLAVTEPRRLVKASGSVNLT